MDINCLGLCDGITLGQLGIIRGGKQINKYFASEIDQKAIAIAQSNYPDTIQLGDIEGLLKINDDMSITVSEKIKQLPKIHILIGGTPCQGISRTATKRENLKDFRSRLFYNYSEILKWLRINNNPDIIFILENVKPNSETLEIMNEEIGVTPLRLNSNLVSAQNRDRLYWTNILGVTEPDDRKIFIKDVLEENPNSELLFSDERIEKTKIKTKNYLKWDSSGKGHSSQNDRAFYKDGKMCCIPRSQAKSKTKVVEDEEKGIYRKSSVTEIERYQTVPDGYTQHACVSITAQYEALGNGFTVDMIAHIVSFMDM